LFPNWANRVSHRVCKNFFGAHKEAYFGVWRQESGSTSCVLRANSHQWMNLPVGLRIVAHLIFAWIGIIVWVYILKFVVAVGD
jgi:hypothetical protein